MNMLTRLAASVSSAKANLINWTRAGSPLVLGSSDAGEMPRREQTNHVNDGQVMSLTAAWRSVKLITETVGGLPLHLKQRTNDVPENAVNHPLYNKLHRKSSTYQTSQAMIEQLTMSLCLWNQAYIRLRGVGNRAQLYAISPIYVRPQPSNDGLDLVWQVSENGKTEILGLDEIIPIDGFKQPGALVGMSVAGMQQAAFSLAIAAEDYGAKFFQSGGRPSGILSTDMILKQEQREQLRKSFSNLLKGRGIDGMSEIHLLEGGLKYNQISTPPDDAQFLNTRKFAVLEVARIFGVPPHMLGELDRATYANAEQNNREFLTYTLLPYLKRIENAINYFLLDERDQNQYFAKFSVEGLLRADSSGRAAFYREGRVGGWLTQNEIRQLEDLPQREGADDLHVALNMAPSDQLVDILRGDEANTQ